MSVSFVAYGTIITDLGMVTADLNMKLPKMVYHYTQENAYQ